LICYDLNGGFKLKISSVIMNKTVLVTGANGFVGRALVDAMHVMQMKVRPCVRADIGDINENTDWSTVLKGVSVVVHCAASINVAPSSSAENIRRVNVLGTMQLARQALDAGVQRLVFLSSIKVNGERTLLGKAFTEGDLPSPEDYYGRSKLEAEQLLLAFSQHSGLEVVIIRPPLVYGLGVRGNFANMLQVVSRGLPLPLGAVNNLRSLVALDNLVSLLLLCSEPNRSPRAANQVFVVADGEDVSTAALLRKIANASGQSCRLLSVPLGWLKFGALILGKRSLVGRLIGNLQVDATKARSLLGWRPVCTMDEQLIRMLKSRD
jgi:nucleoside-diphosphate-sugar epimerase